MLSGVQLIFGQGSSGLGCKLQVDAKSVPCASLVFLGPADQLGHVLGMTTYQSAGKPAQILKAHFKPLLMQCFLTFNWPKEVCIREISPPLIGGTSKSHGNISTSNRRDIKSQWGRMKYCGWQFNLPVVSESCDQVLSVNSAFTVSSVIFMATVFRENQL